MQLILDSFLQLILDSFLQLILDYFLQLILDYFLQLMLDYFLQLILDYFLMLTFGYFSELIFEHFLFAYATPTFGLKHLNGWPHPGPTEMCWKQTAGPLGSKPADDCSDRAEDSGDERPCQVPCVPAGTGYTLSLQAQPTRTGLLSPGHLP